MILHSLASAHAVVVAEKGQFLSVTDPPLELTEATSRCRNVGVWPVLAGDKNAGDTILASPIILPDYPQVAPESQSDLFDSTEIDEILTLRILTLTDQEKDEIRESGTRACELLERVEALPPESLMRLHGVIRDQSTSTACSPWDEVFHAGSAASQKTNLKPGDRVRLRPNKNSDIFDMVLDGRFAVVEAIEEDLESNIQVAIVVEDDPGRDLGEARQVGHRFFFALSEVEPVTEQSR